MPTPGGRAYAITAQNAVAASAATNLILTSTTAIRPQVYFLHLGSSGTPADNAIQWVAQRITAAGTSTAVTPKPLDFGDPASTAVAGKTATVEPTYTANELMLRSALNQRATKDFYFDRTPWIFPATAAAGIGINATHATFTGNVDSSVYFWE